jgi:indole-3-glycerol phosphate synthase
MLLDDIIKNKKLELITLRDNFKRIVLSNIADAFPPIRDFKAAISKPGRLNLIAEVKKASPSAGVLIENFDSRTVAKSYEEAGADAISVLTDYKFFQGSVTQLKNAKAAVNLPVLRKDFILDELQVVESRLSGADAMLLIVRILDDIQLNQFLNKAREINLAVLVEVHSEKDMERALAAGADIIGINNRDLDTLKVDFSTSLNLIGKYKELKSKVMVAESGINEAAQVKELISAGFNAVLIGEALLKCGDIKSKVKELF